MCRVRSEERGCETGAFQVLQSPQKPPFLAPHLKPTADAVPHMRPLASSMVEMCGCALLHQPTPIDDLAWHLATGTSFRNTTRQLERLFLIPNTLFPQGTLPDPTTPP